MRAITTALVGGARGLVATGAMSVPMLVAGRTGVMGTQPPERITTEATRAAGVEPDSKTGLHAASTVAHLGFGASMGAAFALLHRFLRPPGPVVAQGLAYGLGVWAISYKGWVPALGIMPPAHEDRPGRQRVNIAAHLVYGAVLGGLSEPRAVKGGRR